MDGISDDPELAQELLKLLHAKLRDARQELQDQRRASKSEIALLDSTDLQRQNAELREQLTTVRLHLSAAAECEDSKGIFEDAFTSDRDVQEELSTLQEQKAAADAEIEKNKLRLKKYKMKYRQLRTDIVDLEENSAALQADIEHKTEELRDCESHTRIAEAKLCALGPPTPVAPPFDIEGFILSSNTKQLGLPEAESFQSILRSTPLVELPEDILKQFGRLELLVLSPEDTMWLNDGIDRVIFVTPPHQYDPTGLGGSGTWEANPSLNDLIDGVSRNRELFTRWKDDCYYYGTYRCVGYSPLSMETSEKLTTSVVRHAKSSTAIHRDHIAPVAIKFLESLYTNGPYSDGPLELQCFAFERTGFDHDFNEALLSSLRAIKAINHRAAMEGRKAASVVRKLQSREGTKRVRSPTLGVSPGATEKKQKRS